jgi:hypothetical protein
MRVTSLFGSYLKSSDAKDAPIVATISHVAVESVGQGADQEMKPVLHFEGQVKPMVLNKTNAVKLEQALGDESDGWSGHKVKIRVVETSYGGKPVDGLRVEPIAVKPAAKAELNDEIDTI